MVCRRRIDSVRTNALLAEARLTGNLVELVWNQGRINLLLSLFWLRDHCQDPASQHPETKQRLLDTLQFPANLSARAVMVTTAADRKSVV